MTYRCHICDEPITETMLEDAKAGTFFHPDCLPVEAKPEPPPVVETPPLPEWMRDCLNPLPNRIAILEDFEERGVKFRLCEGILQYRDTQNALTEAEQAYIANASEGLRLAQWKRERICLRCGTEASHRGTDWCAECLRAEGWKHYQRLSTKRKEKKQAEAEPTAIKSEERRESLWD